MWLSQIRIYCDESKAPQPLRIESVDEVSSCSYIMKVHSVLLCAAEQMQRPVQPISEISCVPVLEEDDAATEGDGEAAGLRMKRNKKAQVIAAAAVVAAV